MKTLSGLDDKPVPINDDDDTTNIVSYRKMFQHAVALAVPKSGVHAVDLFQLGLKLKLDGAVALENAEFKLLEEVVEANPLQQRAHFLGQAMLKLKEAQ
jgi:hypothetical protein